MNKISSEQLQELLQSDDESQRRSALEQLDSWNPEKSFPYLVQLRRDDASKDIRDKATELLKKIGAIVDLSPMGADSWFDQVKESSPAFETLCDVMGERFVGYALIVGVQISGLTIDQFTPSNTLVEFKIVESSPPRTLRLPEFRKELISWILKPGPEAGSISLPLDLAQAQQLVGVRYILLSPLHNMSLKEVILEDFGSQPKARVVLSCDDEYPEELEVFELREKLHQCIESEIDTTQDEPFELDFDIIDEVEKSAKEKDWDKVLKLIGHWPGPLSMLSRMQIGANLDDEQKSRIGAALGYLAQAYRTTGREAWAEELYRLGLQFAGEGPQGAILYQALGKAMIEQQRFGESIGPLRRAIALGAQIVEIGPSLGLSLHHCRRNVAAIVVLEKAFKEGADPNRVLEILSRCYYSIGKAAQNWKKLQPNWSSEKDIEKGQKLAEEADRDNATKAQCESTLQIAIENESSDNDTENDENYKVPENDEDDKDTENYEDDKDTENYEDDKDTEEDDKNTEEGTKSES